MITQAAAILRLLDDEEPATVSLVKRKLEEIGTVSTLRAVREGATGRAARHLDDLIASLVQRDAEAAFDVYCHGFSVGSDLEEGCWLFAATFRPGDDFVLQKQALDDWGRRLAERLGTLVTPEERVAALARFLATEIGLRGNEADYYNIDNSVLPRVIDSRRGIPITLALIYFLVARRAGMQVDGISLPGHFVARHDGIFFDPFHAGKRIGLEECSALLEQQNLVLTPEHLLPTPARQMLIRMLMNVYYISEQSDPALAEKVGGWIGVLRGEGT